MPCPRTRPSGGMPPGRGVGPRGVALTDTYELEVEEELDERTPCYKVEFKAGGMEYEYKIDARTGGVLTYEMDRD